MEEKFEFDSFERVYIFKGEPIAEMTREELFEVIEFLAKENELLQKESREYKEYFLGAMKRSFDRQMRLMDGFDG